MRGAAPVWLKVAFLLPVLGAGLAGAAIAVTDIAVGLAVMAGSGWIAMTLWFGWPLRYLALVAVLLVWIMLSAALSARIAAAAGFIWVMPILAGVLSALAAVATARIALVWGEARSARYAAEGRPIREWEWIYTGPAFAQTHPLSKSLGAIWLVVVWIAACWAFALLRILDLPTSWIFWGIFAAQTVLVLLAFLTIVRRHPAAWVLVLVILVMSFPLSVPLLVYWVDGKRPNLIYRHRFERRVPLSSDLVGG